ncbi:MFS transporter [Platysternon megacephalum]|uniref:MFS transporter n=1 Tax=Platysternon megacephalum TaxID=55544 RepID=A0A4D9DF60_9SAUR|nr:MFS transporter [Platysternon megacephalum]
MCNTHSSKMTILNYSTIAEVTDQASVKAAAKKIGDHLKGSGLNLLINNAGIGDRTTVDSANPEDVLTMYNINLIGPMLVTQHHVILFLEVTDQASVKAAAKKIGDHLKGSGLNLLINNAGIGDRTTVDSANPEDVLTMYNINLIGPMLVTQKAAQGSKQKGMSCSKAAVINISSALGSLEKVPEMLFVQMIAYHCSKSVLVTGANRGIGLELVKQLVRKPNPPGWIFATCRDPEGARAQELKNLASKHPNLVILQLEATDPESIQATAKKAEAHLGGSGLNLLINNAGVMPESTLESATAADMLAVYKINVVGPMLVTQFNSKDKRTQSVSLQAFLPLLKKAAQDTTQTGLSCGKAAIINVSTIGASIGNTPSMATFPVISYRCSKVWPIC